jgi:hypothetical protein
MNRMESGKNTARGEKTVDARDHAADRQRLKAPGWKSTRPTYNLAGP